MIDVLKSACRSFLKELTPKHIESENLFWILRVVAEDMGYELRAEQRGINGTYIYFQKRY